MKILGSILALIFSTSAWGQQPEFKIRLFSSRLPEQLQIIPQKNTTIVPDCAGCRRKRVVRPQTIRIVNRMLTSTDSPMPAATIRITGEFRLRASDDPAALLVRPVEVAVDGNRLKIVVELALEDYVAAVLAGESSVFRSEESLKAMAVAIRSYALHFRGRHAEQGVDFCDTTHCQDLRLSDASPRLRRAVDATEGEMLWYRGRPAATFYHRDCGGVTEAAQNVWPDEAAPYLSQHQDAFCVAAGTSEWSAELSLAELRSVFGARVQNLQVLERSPSRRAMKLALNAGGQPITAEQFRISVGRALGWEHIRSDLYDIQRSGDRFLFHGLGAGHGVGLCQDGAAKMGEEGRTYREILATYYPGTSLGVGAQGFVWDRRDGERVQLQTTRGDADYEVVANAERILREVEGMTSWTFPVRPQLQIFPTVTAFRDATGEPGWIAASTRGRTIRLQPLETLRSAGTLVPTLRHELFHVLIETVSAPGLPIWFREGIVLFLSDPAGPSNTTSFKNATDLERALEHPQTPLDLRRAYAAARARTAKLVQLHGRNTVLGWVQTGLPPSKSIEF